MNRFSRRAWRIAAASFASGLVALVGCNGDLKEQLLSAPDPDLINPSDLNSPEGADALRLGALGRLRAIASGGESVWLYGGLLVDEWKSSDTFLERNAVDSRTIPDNNGNVQAAFRDVYRARTSAREALDKLNQYKPTPTANVGQMYLVMALAETFLAENFCNGTPLSDASTGVVVAGPPISNAEVFTLALAHVDSAIALPTLAGTKTAADTTAANAAANVIRPALLVARGRILVDLGRFAEAATAVANVSTSFRFDGTHSLTGGNNQIWSVNTSVKRYTVGDSFDVSGIIRNSLPFASAADPRVPVDGSSTGTSSVGRGFDGSTNFIRQRLFGRVDPTPILSGLDARLIEAEAKLKANDIAGMMTILNSLRSSPPTIASFSGTGSTPGTPVAVTPAGLAALATPTSPDAAATLFFREKAFWTFARGQRLSDLRRLIRQYGRSADAVFPAGNFFKTGSPYGSDVNLPVTVDEANNPQSKGCTDRKA